MKRFFIIFLSLVLSLQAFTVFAAEDTSEITTNDNIKVSVKQINKDSYNIKINGVEAKVNIKKDGEKIITNVFEPGSNSKYYFIRNLKENTIYSSLTNTTIPLNDDLKSEDIAIQDGLRTDFFKINNLQNSNNMLRTPIGTTRFIGTKYISTSKIMNGVGAAGTLIQIAMYVLVYFNIIGALPALIINVLSSLGIFRANTLAFSYNYLILDHYQTYSRIRHGETIRYAWIDGYRNVRLT